MLGTHGAGGRGSSGSRDWYWGSPQGRQVEPGPAGPLARASPLGQPPPCPDARPLRLPPEDARLSFHNWLVYTHKKKMKSFPKGKNPRNSTSFHGSSTVLAYTVYLIQFHEAFKSANAGKMSL